MSEKLKFEVNTNAVRELAKILSETGLTEIEYAHENQKIRVVRTAAPVSGNINAFVSNPIAPVEVAATKPEVVIVEDISAAGDFSKHPGAVKSPIVGTVYLSSDPSAKPYVQVGDKVNAGDILMIIEAMKVMNPIRSPRAGTIKNILVKNGIPVEFDEVLLILE